MLFIIYKIREIVSTQIYLSPLKNILILYITKLTNEIIKCNLKVKNRYKKCINSYRKNNKTCNMNKNEEIRETICK